MVAKDRLAAVTAVYDVDGAGILDALVAGYGRDVLT